MHTGHHSLGDNSLQPLSGRVSCVPFTLPSTQHPQVNSTAVWTGPQREFSESQRLQRGKSGYGLSVGEGEEYLHYLQSLSLCLLYPSSSGYQNITKQRYRQLSTLSLSRDCSNTQFYSRYSLRFTFYPSAHFFLPPVVPFSSVESSAFVSPVPWPQVCMLSVVYPNLRDVCQGPMSGCNLL